MKGSIIDKILKVLLISIFTIEIGILTSFYLLTNMKPDRFNNNIKTNVIK